MPRRVALLLALLLAVPLLGGCTEAEETWTLDRKGGGTYELVLRWNADLWRRVRGILGAKVMHRVARPGFPLRTELWRDGLKGLEGVKILELEARDGESGLQELRLKASFQQLSQMLRWEPLAGRTVRVTVPTAAERGKTSAPKAGLYMEPLGRVPVLDRVAALVEAVEKPPPAAEGAAALRDPPPLERMGIDRGAADMVWRMLKPQLAKIRLTSRFHLPGDLVSRRGTTVDERTREAAFTWTFADLRNPKADRTARVRWRMLVSDETRALERRGVGVRAPTVRR